ncbi:MAG TPA: DUF5597 domain-containing protein [Bacteroidota bacterium]|nr:DUF5597 domain-containing protein [Bacteroidota bacterium]
MRIDRALRAWRMRGTCTAVAGMTLLCVLSARPQVAATLPHLARHGSALQLVVHGRPMLMLAGELGNSSASDSACIAGGWQGLRAMHMNAVLVPVYWELVEPEEGKYDFALVDDAVRGARRNGLRVVFLWFGSWKNSMSCYVPEWVKRDGGRFPRSRTADGGPLEILTPFSEENRNADARAFAALMKHIRVTDGKLNTVVMVQVENEIGMIPEARDHCALAEAAFAAPVPAALIATLDTGSASPSDSARAAWLRQGKKTSGSWAEVFGPGSTTDEIFMAWYFARYADGVAAAGKREYPLPMYANAALIRPGYRPGQYPSAGPLPHILGVWRAGAPHIDLFAPDIYFPGFAAWLTRYDRPGNAVFIPEVDRRQSAANAFYAFAEHNAMSYSPFSIESVRDPAHSQFRKAYDVLGQLAPLILAHQGTGTMAGFLLDSAAESATVTFGAYTFTIRHESTWPYAPRPEGETPRCGGLIIMAGPEDYYVAGTGLVVTFRAAQAGSVAGIASIDEGTFVDGTWVAGRRLNGDEDHQGRHAYLKGGEFGIQRVRLYTYK